MKVAFDTNSLVSALIVKEGPSRELVERSWRDEFEMVVSPKVLAELADVLPRRHLKEKYHLTDERIATYLTYLYRRATIAPGLLTVDAVPDDPRDNHVLAAAVETGCTFVVTGDEHLLALGTFQGIRILKPRDLLAQLSSEEKTNPP